MQGLKSRAAFKLLEVCSAAGGSCGAGDVDACVLDRCEVPDFQTGADGCGSGEWALDLAQGAMGSE